MKFIKNHSIMKISTVKMAKVHEVKDAYLFLDNRSEEDILVSSLWRSRMLGCYGLLLMSRGRPSLDSCSFSPQAMRILALPVNRTVGVCLHRESEVWT
jgi:hypothetical protein